jgi:hypothetical protein
MLSIGDQDVLGGHNVERGDLRPARRVRGLLTGEKAEEESRGALSSILRAVRKKRQGALGLPVGRLGFGLVVEDEVGIGRDALERSPLETFEYNPGGMRLDELGFGRDQAVVLLGLEVGSELLRHGHVSLGPF